MNIACFFVEGHTILLLIYSESKIGEMIFFSDISAVEVKPSKVPIWSREPEFAEIVIYSIYGENHRHHFMHCNHQKLKELLDEIRTILKYWW